MSETKQTPANPLKLVNRILALASPPLRLLCLAAAIAQAVRGEPTAHVASTVVGGITWLGVSVMNLAPPPKDQPERTLVSPSGSPSSKPIEVLWGGSSGAASGVLCGMVAWV
jgi:hypothetical protein